LLRASFLVCWLPMAGPATGLAAHGDDDDDPCQWRMKKKRLERTCEDLPRIPYALVGNLRWRLPAPVKKWKDTLDATKHGNTCPQVTTLGSFAGPTSITEDCLFQRLHDRKYHKKPVVVDPRRGTDCE
jgi:para-nitrobenzyl esterase